MYIYGMNKNPVDIFSYYDYRKFLRDSYEKLHELDERFSYRYIKSKTGVDPGYLVKVFNGQKNLAENSIPSFAAILKLNKRQAEYFNYLVLFGRAKSDQEIRHYFEKLLSFTELNMRKIDAQAYEFYTKWYYTAIREILAYYPFSGDYDELAKLTVPKIKPTEAKKAIELLHKLGFIKLNKDGVYEQTTKFITTGEICRSIAVRAFQKDTIQLAKEALDTVPKEMRDISTVTISLSDQGFARVREKLKKFRHEIMKIAKEEDPCAAYHLNLQLLPIGDRWPKEGSE